MIELTGISLAERQKQLNEKINGAVKKKINFEEIKSQIEICDIDKLYKIGVASKYKDVEYIMEVFKSGDSLYISKALKCATWLYASEYSHIINPDYLHENIFSVMSHKMTKKFLTTISVYMNDKRAIEFCTYCNKIEYTNIALKFLILTPELYKLEKLKEENIISKLRKSNELIKLFIGNSFDLAETYYNTGSSDDQANALYQLRYLYFISDEKYFEICKLKDDMIDSIKPIGLRISKDIMKRHKDKIYKKPMFFLRLLNKSMLVRYSTIEDAKFYVKTLISYNYPKVRDFWYNNFCKTYDYIIDKIPLQERMHFFKSIFNDHYPEEEFETNTQFYRSKLYKLMTPDEVENWALKLMNSGSQLFGDNRDYMWYKFVPFDKAFTAIKKYIEMVSDIDTRTNAIIVLVESAKNENELEILFDYYYKMHFRDHQHKKQDFIFAVLYNQNVYDFSTRCWNAFNKLLLNVCTSFNCNWGGTSCNSCKYSKMEYSYVTVIYHIIHRKEISEKLILFLDETDKCYTIKQKTAMLPKDKEEAVYQYLIQIHVDKIKTIDKENCNDEENKEITRCIKYILCLIERYNKSKANIPEIVIKYMKLDLSSYIKDLKEQVQQKRLMVYLKKDKELVVLQLPLIKYYIMQNNSSYILNTFLKILRTYFSNDLAPTFLTLFKDILNEANPCFDAVKNAVYGIIELGDTDFKKDFIYQHVPTEAKIDHTKIDPNILNIQKSICNMACYCRPPLSLSDILKYIKGDYVHFCLPIFSSYSNKLPKPLCMEFVKSLLDSPLPLPKHGFRMAFRWFTIEDFRKLVIKEWQRTKNVSLRAVIYTAVIKKIVDVDENTQNELFKDLKILTSSINEKDDEKIFNLLISNSLPKRFTGKYLEVAWNMVNKLNEKDKFILHREEIIVRIKWYIHLINNDVLESIIYNHVNLMFKQEKLKLIHRQADKWKSLIDATWVLLIKYFTFFTDDDDFSKKTDLFMYLIKECIKLCNEIDNHEYKSTVNQFILKFIKCPYSKCLYLKEIRNWVKINTIFEQILKELQDNLPMEEIYNVVWIIRLLIMTKKIITDGKQKLEQNINNDILIKESLNTFVKEFTNLLTKSVESRNCYVSFFLKIQSELSSNLSDLCISFGIKDNTDVAFKIEHTFVIICIKILEYDSFETHMFALELLPNYINPYIDENDYLKVIYKLKSCKYNEIKCNMYKKFCNDYMRSDFMLSVENG